MFNKLQKLRFTGFEGEWEEKKLGFFIKQKNDRNKKLHIKEVLSINNKKGFITQEEQFNGYEVASKNLSNYKIVKKGYFGYNPSRINVGSIAKLEKLEEGIVSPMYIVFEVDAKLNSSFLLFLFETKDFKDKIKENATGSVRDTLDFKDLSNFSFFFPTTEEQQKIADCLLSLDEKIVAETEQVAQLQQHKKGLLQQLLV
nr:restriction endonuclease subunit S [Capnocytophaga granulosa]